MKNITSAVSQMSGGTPKVLCTDETMYSAQHIRRSKTTSRYYQPFLLLIAPINFFTARRLFEENASNLICVRTGISFLSQLRYGEMSGK